MTCRLSVDDVDCVVSRDVLSSLAHPRPDDDVAAAATAAAASAKDDVDVNDCVKWRVFSLCQRLLSSVTLSLLLIVLLLSMFV